MKRKQPSDVTSKNNSDTKRQSNAHQTLKGKQPFDDDTTTTSGSDDDDTSTSESDLTSGTETQSDKYKIMIRTQPCTSDTKTRAYSTNRYLEDLGILNEHHTVKPDYGLCKCAPYINAIHNRLNIIWNNGRGCPTTLGQNTNIFLNFEVRGGRGSNGALRYKTIPTNVIQHIRAMQNCKVPVLFIPVCWSWTMPNGNRSSHNTFLMINTHNNSYNLFDPENIDMHVSDPTLPNNDLRLNRYKLIARSKQLIRGYVPGPAIQLRHPSLQTIIERRPGTPYEATVVPIGLCALLTTLVLVFCYRFHSNDPWKIANDIADNFDVLNDTQKEKFRLNLYNWYISLYNATSWNEMKKRVGLFQPPFTKDRRCLVYEQTPPGVVGVTLCQNPSLGGHAYCGIHLQKLLRCGVSSGINIDTYELPVIRKGFNTQAETKTRQIFDDTPFKHYDIPSTYDNQQLIDNYLSDLGIWKESRIREQPWKFDRETIDSIYNRSICTWAVSPTTLDQQGIIYWTVRGGNGITEAIRHNKVDHNIIKHSTDIGKYNDMVFLPLCWIWKTPAGDQVGHFTLLVVDNGAKTYNLFDPYDGLMNVFDETLPHNTLRLNRYDLLLQSANMIPGYAPRNDIRSPSLQRTSGTTFSDSIRYDIMGVLWTTLVLVFCHRYQSDNPWSIARCIHTSFDRLNVKEKRMFRVHLQNWYMSIYNATDAAEVERHVGLLQPPFREHRICSVIVGEYNLCRNEVDTDCAYCSVHRSSLLL